MQVPQEVENRLVQADAGLNITLNSIEMNVLYVLFISLSTILLALVAAEGWEQGALAGFDRDILLALREPSNLADPLGPHWLEEAARDFTALGGYSVLTLITILVAGFLAFSRQKGIALILVGITLAATVLNSGLKSAVDRARPDLVPHETRVFTPSFPSGHATHSAATYLTLGALLAAAQRRRRLKAFIMTFAFFIAFMVGCSRVYLGVHWPTDVLAGWVCGTAYALITLLSVKVFLHRRASKVNVYEAR